MNFLQKNKSIIFVLLLVGFFAAILLIVVSSFSGSDPGRTPTEEGVSPQSGLATSTKIDSPSELQPIGSPPPTVISSVTEVPPGTDAPPPPTIESQVTESVPSNDAPPPPTMQNQPTETPPAGNGLPPGA